MGDRCQCRVPFCRRTTGKLEPEYPWLCAIHWRLVPRWMKRRRTKIYRLYLKANGLDRKRGDRAARIYWAWWHKIEKRAIEKAAGITA